MKTKRKQTELICPICGKTYLKDKSEQIRNELLDRLSYCSLTCKGKSKKNLIHLNEYKFGSPKNTFKNCGNNKGGVSLDEFSPFRETLNKTYKRGKSHKVKESTLTLQELKDIWEKQKGICPYTGIELILPLTSRKKLTCKDYEKASLDRIDSSKGYTWDNVEFVSASINYMKNVMSKEDTLELIQIIKNSAQK